MSFVGLFVDEADDQLRITAFLEAGIVRLVPTAEDLMRQPGYYDFNWVRQADPTLRAVTDSEVVYAAGILFVAGYGPDAKVLVLHRTSVGDHADEWGLPGGKLEANETQLAAAEREAREELGLVQLPAALAEHARRQWEGVDYTTFICRIPQPFDVKLNEEHDEYKWLSVDGLVSDPIAVAEGR